MTTAYLRNARDEGRGATVVQKAGSPVYGSCNGLMGLYRRIIHARRGRHTPLGLEEPRIRGLAMCLPRFVLGQPLPILLCPVSHRMCVASGPLAACRPY